MNSKLYLAAGFGAWFITFLLGFFILAPSTDDGYYTIASLGTALTGSPGFWIGDEFAPALFLPVAFTYIYGLLLKLTIILGFDFGPFGFRVYQFLFILLLPIMSTLMLRRLYPNDYGIRSLALLTFLSLTYFVQSAATVRPEVLGALLFVVFLVLRKKTSNHGAIPTLFLAMSGTLHPIFTLLAAAVFATTLLRKYQQTRLNDLKQWVGTIVAFAIPFAALAVYYAINFSAFRDQTLGRASFLSPDILSAPTAVWNHLRFWDDPSGIRFGLFSGYAAVWFVSLMLISTVLIVRRRGQTWNHESLWLVWPVFVVQWVVFLLLPPFTPYLAFSSFLASLIVVLLWQRPNRWTPEKRTTWIIASGGFALCLIFIMFQGGKFLLESEKRLTPAGLYSVMSPVLEDPNAIFYTDSARLIPPLIDSFSEDGKIRLNFTYLSPDCLSPKLFETANRHALNTLANSDLQSTYWGIDWALVQRRSAPSDEDSLSFLTKGSHSTIVLTPSDEFYIDNKNRIIRASSVTVDIDESACPS